jgi:hypothetical protein
MHNRNRYFVTLASGVSFESMVEIAENAFNYKYSNYSDYENYFYHNLNEHEAAYIELVWREFLDDLNKEKILDCSQKIECKGAFFDQVDYTFIFLYNIYLPKPKLTELIKKMLNLKEIQNDDFWAVLNHRKDYFLPSWSGEKKSQVLAKLGIDKVSWPPLISEKATQFKRY